MCRLDASHYIEHFACVDFTEFLFLPYSFSRTGLGLGLIVFGLGLTRHVWSRSRSRSHSLWSWSQSRSHCVVVSLTSLSQPNSQRARHGDSLFTPLRTLVCADGYPDKGLANAKRPCDCRVLCLRLKSSLYSCAHSISDTTSFSCRHQGRDSVCPML